MIFPLKPPFIGDLPLPCLMTRGYFESSNGPKKHQKFTADLLLPSQEAASVGGVEGGTEARRFFFFPDSINRSKSWFLYGEISPLMALIHLNSD